MTPARRATRTPAHRTPRKRKRIAALATVAWSLLLAGNAAAGGQETYEVATSTAATALPATEVAPQPSPSPSPTPDTEDPLVPRASYRLRARVKPGPNADYGSLKTFTEAMSKVRQGSCQQTHNLLWDGEPQVSRVKLKMVRQAGQPEDAVAKPPSGACAAQETRVSGYKLRVRVSYPTPPGDRSLTGRLKLAKAFSVLAERMNAMRDEVLETGAAGKFKLKLIRTNKTVPGMIGGLSRRYGLNTSKALSVARCESGFNPRAYNPAGPWAGVYQQDTDYWPGRSRKYGHPGESVFNAYANVDVSLKMARDMGWGHWACA
jgi:hypothetical protein